MEAAVFTPDWFDDNVRKPKERAKYSKFWVISLLLHSLMIVVIALFHSSPIPEISSPKVAIKARIVFPSLPKPRPEPIEEKPASTGEQTPQQQTKQDIDKVVKKPIEISDNNKPLVTTPKHHPNEAKPRARLNLSPSSALKNLQSENQQTLLEKVSREHRRLLTSPKLIDVRKGQQESTETMQTHKINCDKGVNNIIGFISGITGGSLECSERENDIDKFIDKHKK